MPELKRLEADEARRVVKAFWRQPRHIVRICLLFGVIGGVNAVIAAAYLKPLSSWLRLSPTVTGAVAGGVIGGMLGVAMHWTVRRPMRRYVREYLIRSGVPICVACGYDLRGLGDPRCPECGAACDPRLIRSEPDQRFSTSPDGEPS
ncbi:MAG: hypothetical protein D6744_17760 [Planctomycetota bacterium]|nr:MAG: hypothetical protein D6744_17760 [Planctomycetota bacterium]